ncbi:hypothetical protein TrVGV298_005216 [Trichoderma virens]|nr:hypothetical protein TrVGV298_005216 [Trichoderma virens]
MVIRDTEDEATPASVLSLQVFVRRIFGLASCLARALSQVIRRVPYIAYRRDVGDLACLKLILRQRKGGAADKNMPRPRDKTCYLVGRQLYNISISISTPPSCETKGRPYQDAHDTPTSTERCDYSNNIVTGPLETSEISL